jgi:hypothetical protein
LRLLAKLSYVMCGCIISNEWTTGLNDVPIVSSPRPDSSLSVDRTLRFFNLVSSQDTSCQCAWYTYRLRT